MVDSEETEVCCHAATNAFDGNPNTIWATRWSSASPVPPHEIQINLGAAYQVTGFRYLPRQDGYPHGNIAQYEFYVSTDGVNWGPAVASGTFTNSSTEKQVTFTAKTGQYVRLRSLTEVNGRPWTAVAELNVQGTPLQPPGAVISQAGWTLHMVDSQETEVCCHAATNAFDGNPNTIWATRWFSAAPVPPHEIQINLGAAYQITGFRYLPRQDEQPHGNIAQYEFYVSTDGVNWGAAVAAGTFANSSAEKQVTFTSKTGQYVRLRSLAEVNGRPWTAVAELNVLGTPVQPPGTVISKANWTLLSVDSQETEVCCYTATNAFDGNPNTMWGTRWSSASPAPPHDLRINLGAAYDVSGFRYLPRQDGYPHGNIAQYEFYISSDGTNWGAAVATGTFPNTAAEKQVTFAARNARFVWLRALTEVNGRPWTTVAELSVLASGAPGNQAPDGSITSPAADVTIAAGQSVSFAGSGSDPEGSALTYVWNFGTGGPPSSTSQNPGAVIFPNAGVYVVTFTVTDSQGLSDPVPPTRTVTVQGGSPSGASLIPQSGWSVRFVDDQELNQPGYLAANAIDGNPNTSWATTWFLSPGITPPHEIQIDMGASHNVVGFRYTPHQVWQPGRVAEYEFYVSADGVNWSSPVAVGAFPDVNSAAPRDVMFPAKLGRFVRFRALRELHDRYLTFLGELNMWRAGTGANQPPVASMSSPSQSFTARAGSALSLEGTASDPDGNPLSYRWSMGPGSGVTDLQSLNPGLVHLDRVGTFPLTLTVTDTFGASATTTRTINVVGGQPVAKSGWALRFVDSQETAGGNYAAANAFDNNPDTMWTTQWQSAQPPLPHEIQIDLGATRDVVGFRYLPRQDGETVGNIRGYEFYVSPDGTNWGQAVSIGSFGPGSNEKEVAFPLKSGRYVRLRAITEVGQRPYTAVAELSIVERQCIAPSVQLIQPRSKYIQRSDTLQLVADACPGAAGQGVKFVVDGVTLTTDFSAPYTASAPGLSPAEHIVEAYLVDGGGGPIVGHTTYDRSAPVGIGDTYVAMGDGITYGLGDDIGSDDNSADGRNLLGGFESVLADALTARRGYPVSVVNLGVSATASINGAASINQVLQNYPNANFFIIMYGHNDVSANRPSGRGLVPGNPGYTGSFKDYLQRMITAIRNAGKVPLLSRNLFFPIDSQVDNALRDEYNPVIDELAADVNNGIPVTPPDFYTYFRDSAATLFGSGAAEPNGLGYQAMAQLWRQAIAP